MDRLPQNLKFGLVVEGFRENHVRARIHIGFGSIDGFIQTLHCSRIGAADQNKVGILFG